MQPDWPQNPSLLTTPPVRMAVPTPVPPVRMLETNQATTHNPAQGETSGRDPADRSPVISQGSSGQEEGNPSRLIERHISVNNPRIPVGAEESHMEPDGVTKKEEQRGQSSLRFLRKYLRGPQHPTPLAQNQ
ncbi:hypothetical protein R6Z07F_012475 [Ovis aries]